MPLYLRSDTHGSVYGGNEALLGKWFKRTGKRDKIVLATKFGIKHGAEGPSVDSSPEYCKDCCEASLKKMGVDYIDLCESYLRLDVYTG